MSDQKIVKTISSSDKGGSCTVTISGVLKIEAAAELRQTFAEALAESHEVLLDARQLDEIDISTLQTICSACKTAATATKRFIFHGDIPACMTALNSQIGGHQGLSCRQNNVEPCPWMGGAS